MGVSVQTITPNGQVVESRLWEAGVPCARVKRSSDASIWMVPESRIKQVRPANSIANGEWVQVMDWPESLEHLPDRAAESDPGDLPSPPPPDPEKKPVHRARGISGMSVVCPQCKAAPGEECRFGAEWPAKPELPPQTTGLIEKVSITRDEYMRLLDSDRCLKNLLASIKQIAGPRL